MIASNSGTVDAAPRERAFRGLNGHIGGRDVFIGDVALANAGTLDNPLVVGLDHFFQIVISQNARRNVATERSNFGLWH